MPVSRNSWCLGSSSLRVPSSRPVLRILFPRISENKNTHITISIATPFVAVSGMRTDTAYGRARLPYPRRFAVLVTVYMQAGVIRVYPGWFWRWPVAALRLRLGAYASAACETARSVAVEPWRWNRGGGTQTALAAAVRSHWATPRASGFVCMCWVCVLACLRAAPTPATPMPWPQTAASQLPPYFLGPQNDTRHEYAARIC